MSTNLDWRPVYHSRSSEAKAPASHLFKADTWLEYCNLTVEWMKRVKKLEARVVTEPTKVKGHDGVIILVNQTTIFVRNW